MKKLNGLMAALTLTAAFAIAARPEIATWQDAPAITVGAKMPDGSVYAGISPGTHAPVFTTRADAPGRYTFDAARSYCAGLEGGGHSDWRVPTKNELDVMFNNRAAIGGFDETGSYPAGWYVSSSQGYYDDAWAQRFSDGHQYGYYSKGSDSSLRCVR